MNQKIDIYSCSRSSKMIEKKLNEEVNNGWCFDDAIPIIVGCGGGSFPEGYWNFNVIFVFSKSNKKVLYRCSFVERYNSPEADNKAINEELTSKNQEGFKMVKMIPITGIPTNNEYPTRGTCYFIIIFEKNIKTRATSKKVIEKVE